MDILSIIKSDHDQIRRGIATIDGLTGLQARRKAYPALAKEIETHLLLEEGYLYPEVADLFNGSQILVDIGRANHATLTKLLKSLEKALDRPATEQALADKKWTELKEILLKHLITEEDQLMPKVRATISTQDREDLGQVLMDARELAQNGQLTWKEVIEANTAKPAKRKKRA